MSLARLLCLPALLLAAHTTAALGDPPPGHAAARWGADYFPNVELVTHEGERVRFFDDLLAGKVVVISFIYTSCPDACPLETAKLVEVRNLLGERVGQDVFFYSISIDPETDTPAVLSDYAERFRTGPGWTFLTGAKADIQLVRQKLGLLSSLDERLQDHSLSLMIGNQATGQWMKRSPMENPYLLATQIGSWLHNWKLAPEPGLDYANAPALRSLTRGENLFRTRCATCHGVGATDGFVRQGPDLLGVVERRDPAWLARWIREPDAMLAEKDPLASELLAAWRNVPMPNMRLEVDDVEAVLEYLRDESARVLAAEVWPSDARAAAPPDAGRDEAAPEESEADEPVPPCCQKRDGLVLGASEPLAPTPLPELERAEEAIERELTAFGSPVDAATPPEEHATRSRSLPSSLALALALTAALGLLAARLRGPDSA